MYDSNQNNYINDPSNIGPQLCEEDWVKSDRKFKFQCKKNMPHELKKDLSPLTLKIRSEKEYVQLIVHSTKHWRNHEKHQAQVSH